MSLILKYYPWWTSRDEMREPLAITLTDIDEVIDTADEFIDDIWRF